MVPKLFAAVYLILNAIFEDNQIPDDIIIKEFEKLSEFLHKKLDEIDPLP